VDVTRKKDQDDELAESVANFEPMSGKSFVGQVLWHTVLAEIVVTLFAFLVAWIVRAALKFGLHIDSHYWTVWPWTAAALCAVVGVWIVIFILTCWDAAHRLKVPVTLVYEAWWAGAGSIDRMRALEPDELKAAVVRERWNDDGRGYSSGL
jgi:hypothetical protein